MVPRRSPALITSLRLASAAGRLAWDCVVGVVVGVDEVVVVRVDAAVAAGPPRPATIGESPSRSHHSATTTSSSATIPTPASSGQRVRLGRRAVARAARAAMALLRCADPGHAEAADSVRIRSPGQLRGTIPPASPTTARVLAGAVQARRCQRLPARAPTQQPTAHPAVGPADNVTCSHVLA